MRAIVRIGVVLAALSAATARAQPSPADNVILPCDGLPKEAIASIPAPFDRYMRYGCDRHLGQVLYSVEGFHWADREGHGIGLLAASVTVKNFDKLHGSLPVSWYTRLAPVAMSPSQQQTLRRDLKRQIPYLPRFLDAAAIDSATFLELRATTSNAEEKRILLVVPDMQPGFPKWLAGFECNGVCFRQDTEPLSFAGRPN